MINIFINNQVLYLNPDTSIRFDLVHPAFESDYLYGSMVFPFEIPAYKNQAIFNHANHIIVNNKYRVYDCKFSFTNVLNFEGKLVLSKLTKTSFRGSIIFNGFAVDSKDISIKDFSYGDIRLGDDQAEIAAYINSNVADNYPDVDFNFPMIHVPQWYGENQKHNPDFQDYVNFWLRTSDQIRPNLISETTPDNYNSILPCIYLMYVIESCFNDLGFRTTGDFFSHHELSQLMIFYNVPLDFGENKYTVKVCDSASYQGINSTALVLVQFDTESPAPYQDPDNCWNTTNHEYKIAKEGFHNFRFRGTFVNTQVGNPYPGTLEVYIKDMTDNVVLASFSDSCDAGDSIYVDLTASETFFLPAKIGNVVRVYARGTYDDGSVKANDFHLQDDAELDCMNTSFCNFNSWKPTLHIPDHLPDITFGNLISAISKAFGLYYIFDHERKVVEINFLKDLINSQNTLDLSHCKVKDSHEITLKDVKGYGYQFKWDSQDYDEEVFYLEFKEDLFIGEVDTWDDLGVPTELNVFALVRNMNAIATYVMDGVTPQWKLHSYYFKPFLISPFKEPDNIGFSPLVQHYESAVGLVPSSNVKCSSEFFPTGVNKCDLHLVFWRGMDSQDYDYPFATSLAYDRFGDLSWNNSLRLDTDQGIMKQFLQDWHEFLDGSEEVKLDFQTSAKDLYEIHKLFLPADHKAIRKILVDHVEYIPKKFSFMLNMQGVKSCQATLIKKGNIEL